MTGSHRTIRIGVLALQGAFKEHISLLHQASKELSTTTPIQVKWEFVEVRNADELSRCDALIIPGGESTAISLVAARSNFLEPLREFVKVRRKPVWGTCAGLILLAETANRTKKGGQELIGGMDVRVNRNHFGRQAESFQADLVLPFLNKKNSNNPNAQQTVFKGIFIRAPIVEAILHSSKRPYMNGAQDDEFVSAPPTKLETSSVSDENEGIVEIMATLPGRTAALPDEYAATNIDKEAGDVIAVKQGTTFGTSFHPELTGDPRIHIWWLEEVMKMLEVTEYSTNDENT